MMRSSEDRKMTPAKHLIFGLISNVNFGCLQSEGWEVTTVET